MYVYSHIGMYVCIEGEQEQRKMGEMGGSLLANKANE